MVLAVLMLGGFSELILSKATPLAIALPSNVGAASSTDLSVMTYNVHGLPWPIATGRLKALGEIARHLRVLHTQGIAPRVALLQEAFTADAQAIARTSGYRYAAFGPGDDGASTAPLPVGITPATLQADATWWKGEGLGKWTGSGLAILSDYPIVRVRRMAYSTDACAGYDCLAAKGAMLVELALPDGGHIEVATTHLNSRHASGVAVERANRAWLVQSVELRDFIARYRNPRLPLVLGGDFNVGGDLVRRLGFADMAQSLDRNAADGLRALAARGAVFDDDTAHVLDHGKDWELILAGAQMTLNPHRAWVPFGSQAGSPLSDHFGYAIGYTGQPRPIAAGATSARDQA